MARRLYLCRPGGMAHKASHPKDLFGLYKTVPAVSNTFARGGVVARIKCWKHTQLMLSYDPVHENVGENPQVGNAALRCTCCGFNFCPLRWSTWRSFLRFFSSPGSHRWQKLQSTPF
mmetsp:Transcript_147064/g.409706  ORF Transcript_147064/g.409706 Transcript_147064/m.409706 type:complete len:117 (+) Transcript_147064:129-479(+)